jgi:hypothetical protein
MPFAPAKRLVVPSRAEGATHGENLFVGTQSFTRFW